MRSYQMNKDTTEEAVESSTGEILDILHKR